MTQKKSIPDIALAGCINNARQYLGISQDFVARQMGLHCPAISIIEPGLRHFHAEELPIFARLLHVSVAHLLGVDDEAFEVPVELQPSYNKISVHDREQLHRFALFLTNCGKPTNIPSVEGGE